MYQALKVPIKSKYLIGTFSNNKYDNNNQQKYELSDSKPAISRRSKKETYCLISN